MIGMTLVFKKQVQKTVGGIPQVDDFNNPIMEISNVTVDDCLVAPITEPTNAREQLAMEQSRDQIRIHIAKTSTADVSDSEVTWNGKTFKVDSDSVEFMRNNTPTRWCRYFRAEAIV